MSGDKLAAGARSATFGPAKVSQEKWDRIFGDYIPETNIKPVESVEVERENKEE